MDAAIARACAARGLAAADPGLVLVDKALLLCVHHPAVPSIDLIDLPGLTSTPPEKRDATRTIVQSYVGSGGGGANSAGADATRAAAAAGGSSAASTMFLVVVPAGPRTRLVNEIALEAVEAVKARTIGVLTHADELVRDAHFELLAGLVARPPTADGAVALEPHGWVATMNADVPGARTHLERLHTQMHNERAFFGSNPILKALRDDARAATCDALVQRLVRCAALAAGPPGYRRTRAQSQHARELRPVSARATCERSRDPCAHARARPHARTHARARARTRLTDAAVAAPVHTPRHCRRGCTRSASPSPGSTRPSPSSATRRRA
jgi:hypothetical protein